MALPHLESVSPLRKDRAKKTQQFDSEERERKSERERGKERQKEKEREGELAAAQDLRKHTLCCARTKQFFV